MPSNVVRDSDTGYSTWTDTWKDRTYQYRYNPQTSSTEYYDKNRWNKETDNWQSIGKGARFPNENKLREGASQRAGPYQGIDTFGYGDGHDDDQFPYDPVGNGFNEYRGKQQSAPYDYYDNRPSTASDEYDRGPNAPQLWTEDGYKMRNHPYSNSVQYYDTTTNQWRHWRYQGGGQKRFRKSRRHNKRTRTKKSKKSRQTKRIR